MMSLPDFVHKYQSKKRATSNLKSQQVLGSFGLDNVGIYLGDGLFSSDIAIVNYYPSNGTHCYILHYIVTKICLIHMVVLLLKSCLNLL